MRLTIRARLLMLAGLMLALMIVLGVSNERALSSSGDSLDRVVQTGARSAITWKAT
jgi:hypothetical protein